MSLVSRRSAIKLSGGALLALSAFPIIKKTMAKEDLLSWEDFLQHCAELSKVQFDPDWDQDEYTLKIEKILQKLHVQDWHIQQFVENYRDRNPYFPEIRALHRESQFEISLIEFAEDELIPLHDHPDMTGVILCVEGRVKVEHFDKLEETSENNRPLLQKERSLVMTNGDSAILTATRGNIHSLHAEKFTRMIDVFTPPYNRDRVMRSRYYKLDDQPYRDRTDVYATEVSRSPRFSTD
ncbi:MAG: hypothetical protein OXG88_08335 [Gammaproteobacteria bacterium]|nr:hypothetical protein [Gammaproteobacteria bacterium]